MMRMSIVIRLDFAVDRWLYDLSESTSVKLSEGSVEPISLFMKLFDLRIAV